MTNHVYKKVNVHIYSNVQNREDKNYDFEDIKLISGNKNKSKRIQLES